MLLGFLGGAASGAQAGFRQYFLFWMHLGANASAAKPWLYRSHTNTLGAGFLRTPQ